MKEKKKEQSTFEDLFGFSLDDCKSWKSFVTMMCRPADPSSLAIMRILFGLLMVIDIPQERGMSNVEYRFGQDFCHFPLFNFLTPLPLQWMMIVYGIMWLGACGIMLGCMYRISCLMFMVPYWYIFFLDKTAWNNHSYLYGLLSILLFLTDANRYWSIDGLFRKSIRNSHVPLWNYTLFRFQVFLVYFYAGLKKIDFDWMSGYSMTNLSKKWVFDPFRLILTNEQIDLYVVHLGGLFLDLTAGFLLFFDKTRPLGFFFIGSFHFMNSQMFSIGMFSYTMLGTMFIFCCTDWPKRILYSSPSWVKVCLPTETLPQTSTCCIYSKEDIKPDNKKSNNKAKTVSMDSQMKAPPTSPSFAHQIWVIIVLCYIAFQLFLPYSHGVTKGYNNWTNGLYGYSWDMMVHSWSTQHIRITYKDKKTGDIGYLSPSAFINERTNRWSSHGDMLKQYGTCISEKLKKYELHDIELYFDVWKSMNQRFQQRMFDPRVNILEVEWHPFKALTYSLPLLVDLSGWRQKLDEIHHQLDNQTEAVFVADFPGLYLENFVQEDLGNTTLSVLSGEIIVELTETKKNITLSVNESLQIPPGHFHNVHTISDVPSCYMYLFVNTTDIEFERNFTEYQDLKNQTMNCTDNCESVQTKFVSKYEGDPLKVLYEEKLLKKQERQSKEKAPAMARFTSFVKKKYFIFKRSFRILYGSVRCLILQQDFDEFMKNLYEMEAAEENKSKSEGQQEVNSEM